MVQSLVERNQLYTGLRFASDTHGEARAAVLRK
jgi:hypothetical protein